MKKIVLLLMLALSVGLVAGQEFTDIKISQLPKKAQEYLASNMKGMTPIRTVKIEKNGILSYGVVYEVDGRKRVLGFDKDGNFTQKVATTTPSNPTSTPANSSGTAAADPTGVKTTAIAADKLPATVQSYIKTKLPAGKIVVSNQLTEKGVVSYQVTVIDGNTSHVMTFDSKGKYLSEQTFIKH